MTNTTAANGKEAAYHGVPAEDDYGYAQAIKIASTIHVSGQLSQDDRGTMIAPAALDESGNFRYNNRKIDDTERAARAVKGERQAASIPRIS